MESFAFSIIVATGKFDENDFPICRARHFNTISHHRIQMQQKSSISCSGTTKYQLITLNFLFRNLQMVQKALTLLNSKTFRRFSVVYYSPSWIHKCSRKPTQKLYWLSSSLHLCM
jgi:hypothetical protein